jgi:hypothetical protein
VDATMIGEYEKDDLKALSFQLQVEGDHSKITSVRLSLLREGSGVTVEGELGDGQADFDLTAVREGLSTGDYDVLLEVVLDENRYFQPVRDKMRIKRSPKVEAVPVQAPAVPAAPRVAARIMVDNTEDSWVKKHEAKGLRVVESSDKKRLFAMNGRTRVAEFVR